MIITVPRTYEGPRHDRAYAIWEAAAEYMHIKLEWLESPGSHLGCLRKWRDTVMCSGPEYSIFCEADFLPEPSLRDLMYQHLDTHSVVCPAAYRQATPDSEPLRTEMGAGWIVGINPFLLDGRKVDFRPGPGDMEDPGNALQLEVPDLHLLDSQLKYPGLFYPGIGLHTFWSTAWNGNMATFGPYDGKKILAAIDDHLTAYERLWL